MTLPSVETNQGLDYLYNPNDPARQNINPAFLYVAGLCAIDLVKDADSLSVLEQFINEHPYLCPARSADLIHGLPPILVVRATS
jgi:hypothetical protein